MPTPMTTGEAALYHLLTWLSPAYPVGAFSHSGGLEWAVEAGWVTSRAQLEAWLADLLEAGAGWNDAVLFAHAHRAAGAGKTAGDAGVDAEALARVAELAAASPAYERRLETLAQGEAFRRIALATSPVAVLAEIEGEIAYPVAVAAMAAGHGVELAPALTAYLHGLVGNLVSAAQRLIPLGQTDGQRAVVALRETVAATVARAVELSSGDPFEHMGGMTLRADLATMLHETQYTRLFRT